MLPVYAQHKSSAIFFVIYLVIQTYFVLNMMLAVSYEKYSSVAKEKFRRLFLHRRLCCRHAFALLTSDKTPNAVTFKAFEGVVSKVKPGISRLRCYLMFKLCDTTRTGTLTLEQFYRIYDAIELNWAQVYPEVRWYHCMQSPVFKSFFDHITRLSKSPLFEKIVDCVLILILVIELLKTSKMIPNLFEPYEAYYTIFIGFYILEATIKIIGFGFIDYITNGWNPFDFIVTGVSMIGHYIQPWGYSFGFFYLLRTFRILRVFEKTKRYQHIMGPFIFIIFRQMTHFSVIVFVVLFSFSILGMFLFAAIDLKNPPPAIDEMAKSPVIDEYYKLHNFQDIASAFLSLLILSFTYLWSFAMDRYAKLAGPWSRVYFMAFYVISTVVLKIVVSSILEAFLFVMKCKRRLIDIEGKIIDCRVQFSIFDQKILLHFFFFLTEQTRVVRDISLSVEELEFLDLLPKRQVHNVVGSDGSVTIGAIFRGSKLRTKFSFACKMYDQEMKEWIEEEEAAEKLAQLSKNGRRRAFSCKV